MHFKDKHFRDANSKTLLMSFICKQADKARKNSIQFQNLWQKLSILNSCVQINMVFALVAMLYSALQVREWTSFSFTL